MTPSVAPLRELPAGTLLARLHLTTGAHPMAWNSWRTHGPLAIGRFDHHPPPAGDHPRHGVIYAALASERRVDPLTQCLAEVFQRDRTITLQRATPTFTLFELARDTTLLDLRSTFEPTLARTSTQQWAREAFASTRAADGVLYPSALIGRPGVHPAATGVCLWRRRASCLPPRPLFSRPLIDPALRGAVERAAHELDFLLVA